MTISYFSLFKHPALPTTTQHLHSQLTSWPQRPQTMRSHQTGTALYSHHQIYQIACFVPTLCPASWTMEGVLVPLKSQPPTPVPWIPPSEPSQGFPPSLTPFLPSYAIFPFPLYHSHQHTDLFCHLFYLKTLLLLCFWLDQNFSKVMCEPPPHSKSFHPGFQLHHHSKPVP